MLVPCSCEPKCLTRTLRHVANILQHPTEELQVGARTKEIPWARIPIVPLKVYFPEEPITARAR